MKVAVTGGNGKLGRVVVADLISKGYEVLSLDRVPHSVQGAKAMTVDIQHEGQVFDAICGCEALVHLAGYARPSMVPDFITFSENVKGTYNVLNACSKMGIKNVVCASSMAAYGFRYAPVDLYPEHLPIDETYRCEPIDPYGLSKLVGETIADSFSRLSEMKIVSFRLPQVIEGYDILQERLNDPSVAVKSLWLYIDIRDAARGIRVAIESDLGPGHEVILIASGDSAVNGETADVVRKFLPNTRIIEPESVGNWSCLDISKAGKILGFLPEYNWKNQTKL